MWLPPAWLFPVTIAASLTFRVFGSALLVGAVLAFVARKRSRPLSRLGLAVMLVAACAWAGLYALRPSWQRAALAEVARAPTLLAPAFTRVAPGVEVATYRLLDGADHRDELEVVELVRLDPALHRFEVATDAQSPIPIAQWRERLHAVAVVNGSYYLPDKTPQTPLRSHGAALGPAVYASTHAAFVSDPARGTAAIVELDGVELPRGLTPFPEAMTSYPLLLAHDGSTRAAGSHDWLASRTFVGVDRRGWVVLGTTRNGYFSLRRLAAFLHDAPLALDSALNLDGGPIAAQAVHAGDFDRVVTGDAETNEGADVLRARFQAARTAAIPLPIVLAALPR
jgi:hypothetical protein